MAAADRAGCGVHQHHGVVTSHDVVMAGCMCGQDYRDGQCCVWRVGMGLAVALAVLVTHPPSQALAPATAANPAWLVVVLGWATVGRAGDSEPGRKVAEISSGSGGRGVAVGWLAWVGWWRWWWWCRYS